jgi:NAD(P)-dependent dehydrogenase (short-subunit alcohol dehydrogenase family)
VDLELKGKSALVTGASRGIGKAIAMELASEGADLAICARDPDALNLAAEELSAVGGSVFARSVDVTDTDGLRRFVHDAAADLGGLDIYVSNASEGAGPPQERAWRRSFEVDVLGAVTGVNAAVRHLSASGAGSVVFLATVAALENVGGPGPYAAMKAGVLAYMNELSQFLGRQGIRCNAVSPGPIYFDGSYWRVIEERAPEVFTANRDRCALGRMGTPTDVAKAVTFLASPAAGFVTGVNLVVDGGYTKRFSY